MGTSKNHWENVYKTKLPEQVSWFQSHLAKSLELIVESGIDKRDRIIDVGGGASTLVDDLLTKGYGNLAVLDISAAALHKSKERLGERADKITWIEADILKFDFQENSFDLWHDRAVFHFLTEPDERKKYIKALERALKPEGFFIIASFNLEGPSKCSGLDVMRYNPETLSQELGSDFLFLESMNEQHQTPSSAFQSFIYCIFKKR